MRRLLLLCLLALGALPARAEDRVNWEITPRVTAPGQPFRLQIQVESDVVLGGANQVGRDIRPPRGMALRLSGQVFRADSNAATPTFSGVAPDRRAGGGAGTPGSLRMTVFIAACDRDQRKRGLRCRSQRFPVTASPIAAECCLSRSVNLGPASAASLKATWKSWRTCGLKSGQDCSWTIDRARRSPSQDATSPAGGSCERSMWSTVE